MSTKKGGEALGSNGGDERDKGNGGGQDADPPAPDPGYGGTDASGREPDPTWALHRLEVARRKALHDASAKCQDRVLSAFAANQRALAELTSRAYDRELAATAEAAGSDAGDGSDQGPSFVETLRKWRSSVDQSRREAAREAGVAEREFVDAWQGSWLDLLQEQQDANTQYMRAVEEAYGSRQPADLSAPFVAGDEGPPRVLRASQEWNAWPSAPLVAGDEGIPRVLRADQEWNAWPSQWARQWRA